MARLVLSRGTERQRGACGEAAPWEQPFPLTWRLVLGCVVAVVLTMGVNLYAFFQLRQVTTLSIDLVSYRYPAIESAKWLLTSLYAQLTSEKKYLAVRDPWFLIEFNDEAAEFRQTLMALQNQERSPEGQTLLEETDRLYAEYRGLFRTHVNREAGLPSKVPASYEKKRDAVIEQTAHRLQAYVGLHETLVSSGVNDVRLRSSQVQILTQLAIIGLLLTLVTAGVVGFSVLRALPRGQDPVAQLGSGVVNLLPAGGTPPALRDAGDVAAVLMPRAWRQAK